MRNKGITQKRSTLGDAAVDGLIAGIIAGVVGALFLIIVGLASGDTVLVMLSRFDPRQSENAIVGIVGHLGVSAVYGSFFAVLYRPLSRRLPTKPALNLVIGLLYGLILMLIAELLLVSGIETALGEIPTVQFALFHVIYGLSLVYMFGRLNDRVE
jgi:NhaP-type Na+/H+ or K+/H+ antiporter